MVILFEFKTHYPAGRSFSNLRVYLILGLASTSTTKDIENTTEKAMTMSMQSLLNDGKDKKNVKEKYKKAKNNFNKRLQREGNASTAKKRKERRKLKRQRLVNNADQRRYVDSHSRGQRPERDQMYNLLNHTIFL